MITALGFWRLLLRVAIQNDVQGLISCGITYHGSQHFAELKDLRELLTTFPTIYLEYADLVQFALAEPSTMGKNWEASNTHQPFQATSLPGVFVGKVLASDVPSIVESAARGRQAAISLCRFLDLENTDVL